jgi:hypothetical protein
VIPAPSQTCIAAQLVCIGITIASINSQRFFIELDVSMKVFPQILVGFENDAKAVDCSKILDTNYRPLANVGLWPQTGHTPDFGEWPLPLASAANRSTGYPIVLT